MYVQTWRAKGGAGVGSGRRGTAGSTAALVTADSDGAALDDLPYALIKGKAPFNSENDGCYLGAVSARACCVHAEVRVWNELMLSAAAAAACSRGGWAGGPGRLGGWGGWGLGSLWCVSTRMLVVYAKRALSDLGQSRQSLFRYATLGNMADIGVVAICMRQESS